MADRKPRLSVIIVSANSAKWLRPCLTTVYERAGDVDLDVVVVAAGCTDETVPLVERHFPQARTISCPNRGFAFANNRALRTVDADWVLFLNPDTEILEGSFADLIDTLGPRSTVGLAGVRQVTADGQLFPTIRHFPNAIRFLFETLGSERFPIRTSWLGERELDLRVYERDIACDWTSGSFMLVRWEALPECRVHGRAVLPLLRGNGPLSPHQAGGLGDSPRPYLTILHHANKGGWNPQLEAQVAYAKRQYIEKHLSPIHQIAAKGALVLGFTLRSALGGGGQGRKGSSRAALATLLGLRPPPFGEPPQVSLAYEPGSEPPRVS